MLLIYKYCHWQVLDSSNNFNNLVRIIIWMKSTQYSSYEWQAVLRTLHILTNSVPNKEGYYYYHPLFIHEEVQGTGHTAKWKRVFKARTFASRTHALNYFVWLIILFLKLLLFFLMFIYFWEKEKACTRESGRGRERGRTEDLKRALCWQQWAWHEAQIH